LGILDVGSSGARVVEVSVPEIDERPSERSLRPRGRRAAPKSRLATALEPLAPALAATTAWLSKHRLGALIAAASLATVAMLGGGIALIQSAGAGAGAPGDDDGSYSMLDDPRPTSTAPAGPSRFGPILPTPKPGAATPTPTPPSPEAVVEPPVVDEPVVEPTPTTGPDPDGPGRGNGPKKPKG
jgi:hypothetical protein